MEKKDTGFKVIAICGLLIAVVGLTIGFAALSATLTINNTTATVKEIDAFSPYIGFTAVDTCSTTKGTTTSGLDLTNLGVDDISCTSATLATAKGTKDSTTYYQSLEGFSAVLYASGDSATQTATIKNGSLYAGTLTNISTPSAITCAKSATSTLTDAEVTTICSKITATVTVGSATATLNSTAATNATVSDAIGASATKTATVKIEYNGDLLTDGDITVTIPTISLIYSAD